MRARDTNPDTQKEVFDVLVESAQSMSNLANKYHDILTERGHVDFTPDEFGRPKITKDDTYSPFVYDKGSFARYSNQGLESKHFISFFKNAMKSKSGDRLNDEILKGVATKFYHAVSGSSLESKGTMKDIMREMHQSATSNEEREIIESMMTAQAKAVEEAGGTSDRERTNIDYTYNENFIGNEGKEIE